VTTVEREIKLAPPDDFQLPPLTDPGGGVFASPETTASLVARYYDTDDLRITRAGASLRYRDPEGWTVKLPRSDGDDEILSRDEHHLPGDRRTIPDPAIDLVRSITRGRLLQPVATLSTARTTITLHDARGESIGEVVDDTVEVALPGRAPEPGREPEPDPLAGPARFAEVEIELTEAATKAHRAAILARLRSAGAVSVELTPKIVRALGVRASRPADVVVRDLGDDFPAVEEVVRRAIASSVDRLITYDPIARLGEDPEGVHQARVATRRLRSDLRTFRSLIDEQWGTGLSDELRWLGDVFGVVRDADVLYERLEPKIELLSEVDREPAKRILDHLRSDQARGRDQMLRALRSERYDALLDQLVAAAARPRFLLRVDDESDESVLRSIVRRPWRKLEDAVDALGDDPPDVELHGVRIRAKRARYAAEAVVPAFGKPARAYAKAITGLQDVLGEHQDAVVAAEWLRRAAATTDDEASAFAAGQLAAVEYRGAERSRKDWPDAWRRASRKRLRGWW
jgi:CHAD domain-containing protein